MMPPLTSQGMRPAIRSADVAEPLSDAYLQQCEFDARKFSGAYTGTSGTLAAHVMRLLTELSRIKGELAVERARRDA
jgi:hypothetical protein